MQGMIAEYEREKSLERTRRGRRFAATSGRVSVFSGEPYGYRYLSRSAGGGQAAWEINPAESEAVKLAVGSLQEGTRLPPECALPFALPRAA